MNADVLRAREAVTATLQAAVAASREHSAALAAVAIEEAAAWDAAAEGLVPRLERTVLRDAGAVVGEPRLHELMDAHDAAMGAADSKTAELQDEVLEPADFEALSERRKSVDARLVDARSRLKELRARPGMLQLVGAAQKGARLKDDQVRAMHLYDELQGLVTSLEAESSRLAAITARHHRARRDLANANDDQRSITERFLIDARRIVVEHLRRPDGPRPARPDIVRALQRVEAAAARRAALTVLYESWVRPHGVALMGLEVEASQVSGFETVSWPAKAELACRDAGVAVDAYRQRATPIAASPTPTTTPPDWWHALVPDVPRPDDSVFVNLGVLPPARVTVSAAAAAPAQAHASDAASDKLAAAWASLRVGSDHAPGEDGLVESDGAIMSGDLSPGETELLALPRAPSVQHTNANVAISSAEFLGIFDDVRDPEPSIGTDVFAAAATSNPFVRPPPARAPAPTSPPSALSALSSSSSTGGLQRPTFAPGSLVGRCTVLGLIGKGGMGEVYRARLEGELGFSRQVVLKRLLLDHGEDETLLTSFVREAEVAARIAHPNVVQIFDLQRHGGEPVMIMEYLEGLSLQKLATRTWRAGMGLDAHIVTRCALDAARGLHAAHTMRSDDGALVGLVHRDVSPDNLFLCTSGFTKLLDFGIARRSDLKTMTGKNELKGKIPYMSPEQILGDDLDARSDLFSLGSTLYYLLTGKRPFVGDNDVTTLYAVVNKAHRPLAEVRPDAPELTSIVDQLLQKAPDDRPISALEVVHQLERTARVATAEDAAAFLRQIEEL